jgi:hypothetical protein
VAGGSSGIYFRRLRCPTIRYCRAPHRTSNSPPEAPFPRASSTAVSRMLGCWSPPIDCRYGLVSPFGTPLAPFLAACRFPAADYLVLLKCSIFSKEIPSSPFQKYLCINLNPQGKQVTLLIHSDDPKIPPSPTLPAKPPLLSASAGIA